MFIYFILATFKKIQKILSAQKYKICYDIAMILLVLVQED